MRRACCSPPDGFGDGEKGTDTGRTGRLVAGVDTELSGEKEESMVISGLLT